MSEPAQNAEPELITEAEAADLLKARPATLKQWRHKRQGPKHYKLGGYVRYNRQDLLAWIAGQGKEAEHE